MTRIPFSAPGLRSTGVLVLFGFAAMMAFMAILASIGLAQLEDSQHRLERVVSDPVAKITLANRMYVSARERTVSLQRLILLSDPFERDEEWIRYLSHASEFGAARQALLALPLGETERELLNRQGRLTSLAVPVQDRVVALMNNARQKEAHALLVTEAIPAQDRVLRQLRLIYELQEEQVNKAEQAARLEFRNARVWLMTLAVITFCLALLIALIVLYRSRQAETALREEKERAQVTLHSLSEAVIRADAAGKVEYLNAVAERLTGWTLGEAQGQPLSTVLRVVHEISREPMNALIDEALQARTEILGRDDALLIARGGEERAVEFTAALLPERAGAVLVFRDVTEVRAMSRELSHQATHDPMTGLVNRREFERRLQQALEQSRLSGNEHVLCYFDLDLFKVVNDTCGHLAGDELLKQLASMLRARVRKEDLLARIGGDEFAVLLHGCHLGKAVEIGEGIRQAFRDFRFAWEDKRVDVGASIGIVPVGPYTGDLNDVLRSADVACRIAKEEGRNRLHVMQPNDLSVVKHQREISWVQSLQRAIEHGDFVLYGHWIQPLDRERGLPALCEVLLRMRDGGQLVSPSMFLPAAERYHLMPSIDRWVVRAVFQALRDICPSTDVCFNINLSGQTLCDPEFLPFLEKELKDSGLPPTCVGFEITESAAVTHMNRAVQLINTLRARGCRFSLDDFGSGLSSFTYLKHMQVDFLKIDGAFVQNSPIDQADLAMVTSINQVAHVLGVRTVAEYVETAAIREAMARIGVDYGQGDALSPPTPLASILAGLRPGHDVPITGGVTTGTA